MQEGTIQIGDFLNYSPEELVDHFNQERNRARMHSFSEVSELVLHDLTNPLSVVKFCVEQLELKPDLFIEKPHYLERIKKSLDQAFDIIDSFRGIVRQATQKDCCRFETSHFAAIKLVQAQFKKMSKDLTVNFDASLEGIIVRIPHFDAVFILDTIYRFLLAHTSCESETVLSIKRQGHSDNTLFIEVSSNSRSLSTDKNGSSLNLFNLKVINQQLVSYGGYIVPVDKSLTECTGTNLRIGLPLEVGE